MIQTQNKTMNESKRFYAKATAKIAVLGLAAILSGCADAPKNSDQLNIGSLATVNYASYNQEAVSNFCNELIASRENEKTRRCFGGSEVDANKAYILKLTEIIASLKGDDYSSAAYTLARSEFHKAVEVYSK